MNAAEARKLTAEALESETNSIGVFYKIALDRIRSEATHGKRAATVQFHPKISDFAHEKAAERLRSIDKFTVKVDRGYDPRDGTTWGSLKIEW